VNCNGICHEFFFPVRSTAGRHDAARDRPVSLGVVAYRHLPLASLPNIDFPTIHVSASRPGADPATMAATVAAPVERRLGEIAGVTDIMLPAIGLLVSGVIGVKNAAKHRRANRVTSERQSAPMKIFALIAALLLTASPAAAQVATSLSQQQLGGQSIQSAGTEAPSTGVFCNEEMTATFCNVPSGPSGGGYGPRGVSTSGSGAASRGISAPSGGAGGISSSIPPCGEGLPPFNELCN
jgi:AcrB/AcrD/AcrF family protein